ncbi:MAG: hypothetical protein ACTSVY_03700, partial [Candidatus Helarchaeota archaeon]
IHDPKIKPTICKEWHTEYIDLRCVRTRQIINEMYELKFDTILEEWIYYEGLIRDYIRLRQKDATKLFFKTLLEITRIKNLK